jgi:single-strand DNA-binding protein
MSGFLNRVTLIGNLGADPEIRHTQSGQRIVSMSIATSERWKDPRSGETRERTEWHRIVIFNDGLGKVAEQYLTKGAKVLLEGQMRTRKWQDQSGHDRHSTEVVLSPFNGILTFLDNKRNDNGTTGERAGSPSWDAPKSADLDDEVPF